MSKSLAIAVSLTLAAAIAAHAQNVRQPVAPEPLVPGQADMMKLQTAMIAAQQAAIQPGDDASADAAGDRGAAASGGRLHESARADHAGLDAQSAGHDAGGREELYVGYRRSRALSRRRRADGDSPGRGSAPEIT